MFKIPKTANHPGRSRRSNRLAFAEDTVQTAWADWFAAARGLVCAAINDEVTAHIRDLDELVTVGRPERQDCLRAVATGELVPVFDSDGIPVLRNGEQMYTTGSTRSGSRRPSPRLPNGWSATAHRG
jgi:hypothetical protein